MWRWTSCSPGMRRGWWRFFGSRVLRAKLCAGLLASLGDLLGIDDPGVAIAHFDAMSADDLKAAASWLAAPVTYRAALNALAGSNG